MTSIPRGRRDGLVVNKNILCYEGLRTHNFMPTRGMLVTGILSVIGEPLALNSLCPRNSPAV